MPTQARAPQYHARNLPPHSGTSSRVRNTNWGRSLVAPTGDSLGRTVGTQAGHERSRQMLGDYKLHQRLDSRGTNTDWFTEVDRAIENLVKSGKLFGPPGGRREFPPVFPSGPARLYPDYGGHTHSSRVLLAGSRPPVTQLTSLLLQTPAVPAVPSDHTRLSLTADPGLPPRTSRTFTPLRDINPRADPTTRNR